MLKRWLRGGVALAFVATAALGMAAPAQAADDLVWIEFGYTCSGKAGERTVSFVIVPSADLADATGVITAFSLTGATYQESFDFPLPQVGSVFGKEISSDGKSLVRSVASSISVGPGPDQRHRAPVGALGRRPRHGPTGHHHDPHHPGEAGSAGVEPVRPEPAVSAPPRPASRPHGRGEGARRTRVA